MVSKQPQEMSLAASLIDEKEKTDEDFLAKVDDLPQKIIQTAESKLTVFNQLKSEIDAKLLGVHQTLDGIRQTIRDNI